MSPPIRQALPGDALECLGCAFFVIDAELFAVVVSEIEFGNVALKMLPADMLIRTNQAALQNTEVVFDGVGMRDPAHIFAFGMIDRTVRLELFGEVPVARSSVRHQVRAFANLPEQERLEARSGDVRDVEASRFAVALDQGKDRVLVAGPSFLVNQAVL